MTPFDIGVLIVVTLSLLYSLLRGMVRELFSILSLGAGYLVAANFSENLGDLLCDIIPSKTFANLTAFVVLFLVTLLFVSSVGKLVRNLLKSSDAISGWDRLLGGMFGVVKGVLFIIILLFPLHLFQSTYQKVTQDSLFAPPLEKLVLVLRDQMDVDDRLIHNVSPGIQGTRKKLDDLQDRVRDKARELRDNAEEFTEVDGEPLDEYTSAEKEKLVNILKDISKE